MRNSSFLLRKATAVWLFSALALALMITLPSRSVHAQNCAPGDTLYIPSLVGGTLNHSVVTSADLVIPPGVTTLHIFAKGGDGGRGDVNATAGYGGSGATIEGDFPVTPGDTLRVFAGHSGHTNPINSVASGGGGATAIINISQGNTPLLIAGGGGGGGAESPFFTSNNLFATSLDGKGGNIGLNGTSSGDGNPGGVAGAGGSGSNSAGGGGGLNSGGAPSTHGGLAASPQGVPGGYCCNLNVILGGSGYISAGSPPDDNGFNEGGGGGGGYSGGGGGGTDGFGGGGGGSFVVANATNVIMTPGTDGSTAVVTPGRIYVCGPPPVIQPPNTVPTLGEWGLIILGLLILCLGAIAVFNRQKEIVIET